MRRYNLSDFDAVLAVSRLRSFRAAALELSISTSALSNAIAKLERQLGVRLFNRTTRSVALTEAGGRFVDQLGPALRDIDHAIDSVRSQQTTPSGTLRINTFAAAGRELMEPLVLEFLSRYPEVRIDLVTEGNLVDIVGQGFDFGIRSESLVPTDMIAIPLTLPRRYAVVGSPAYFQSCPPPRVPADLLAHSCIRTRLPNGALLRWRFEADGEPFQIDVDGPITLDEASLARIAVLQSIGIGFFMEADVREDIAEGRLIRVLEDWTPPLSSLCLYYPSKRNPPAAFRLFVDLARELSRAR